MDDSDFDISWSSADAAALLASLDSGGSNPTSPTDRGKGSGQIGETENPHGSGCIELKRVEEASRIVGLSSVGVSEPSLSVTRGRRVIAKRLDLRRSTGPYSAAPRPTRQGHHPPLELPLPRPYPTSRFPSGRKRPRGSEDRRTPRGPYSPPPSRPLSTHHPSSGVSVVQPPHPFPSDRVELVRSEDRRTLRARPYPTPSDSYPRGVGTVRGSEDRRTSRPVPLLLDSPPGGLEVEEGEGSLIPRPEPSPLPPITHPSGVPAAGRSEDRRTLLPAVLLLSSADSPQPSPLPVGTPVSGSRQRCASRRDPSPNPPDSEPYGVEVAGESEDRRTLRSTPLIPCLPSHPLVLSNEGARFPVSTDRADLTAPEGNPKRKRTRRAGRKNQLRRLWTRYIGVDLSAEGSPTSPPPTDDPLGAESSQRFAEDQPALPTPGPGIPTGPRIIEDVPYQGPRITRWRLAPIRLEPVVYPSTIPLLDPRRSVYMRQRARALYPQPPPP